MGSSDCRDGYSVDRGEKWGTNRGFANCLYAGAQKLLAPISWLITFTWGWSHWAWREGNVIWPLHSSEITHPRCFVNAPLVAFAFPQWLLDDSGTLDDVCRTTQMLTILQWWEDRQNKERKVRGAKVINIWRRELWSNWMKKWSTTLLLKVAAMTNRRLIIIIINHYNNNNTKQQWEEEGITWCEWAKPWPYIRKLIKALSIF